MATSAGVRTGQRVTITACTLDPDLVGQVWRVRDPAGKSFATARRVAAERIG
jgi:hypothetical protein